MPKMKSHKGMLKRVKITAKGKIKHKRPGTSHLMSHMSGNQVRKLRKGATMPKCIARQMEAVLHCRLTGH